MAKSRLHIVNRTPKVSKVLYGVTQNLQVASHEE